MVDKWYKSKRMGAALLGVLTAAAPYIPKVMEAMPQIQAVMGALAALLAVWSKAKEKK